MKLICVCLCLLSVGNASNCTIEQHCSSCDNAGLCISECQAGFYGKECNIKCSPGCSKDVCTDGDTGVEKCTFGCKPGNYGSRCQVPCREPATDKTCQKCPVECEDGFCDLGTSCVTGCVDNYYGYNNSAGCHVGCGQNCTETTHVKALICKTKQHCSSCDKAGLCLSECERGFYGKHCSINCSSGCSEDTCVDGDNGVEKCTLGCKPGYIGSRCEVPCRKPSADETCQRCPVECEGGFCDLGTNCVSGCVNNYYGYNCTCNTTAGCHPECGDKCTETSPVQVYIWVLLACGVLVLFSITVLASSQVIQRMKKREHPAVPELGQNLRLDGTDDYDESRRSGTWRYIHAVDEHYAECDEESMNMREQPTRSELEMAMRLDETGVNAEARTCGIGSYIHAIDD